MTLPYFKFHPEPLKTGAIVVEAITCECCGKDSDYRYDGPFYSEKEVTDLCPDCIANGQAATRFDGCFTERDDIQVPRGVQYYNELLNEIALRTPGLLSDQQGKWLWLENAPGVYQGHIGLEFAETYGDDFWISVRENSGISEAELPSIKAGIKSGAISLYCFKSLHSDRRSGYIDHT